MKLACLLMLLFYPLHALAAEPFAKATVTDDGRIVPGQQVYVTVDVFAPDFFTSPPQFPLFEMPNTLVTLPEERAQNLTQTIDGIQYSGIRRRYAVVPEIPGDYTLPAIEIELGYSVDGEAVRRIASTAPVSFAAHGEADAKTGFAARDVTIEQTFDRDPASLKVGDALVRTIAVTAGDTQAIMIPPVEAGVAAGVAQYTKTARTEDGLAIGRETASRRTEIFVYTASADGRFTIPAVEYPWFDVESGEISYAHLPATAVLVAVAPAKSGIAPDLAPERATTPFERRRHIMLAIGLFLAIAAAAWTMRHFPRAVARYLAALRSRMLMSRRHRLRLLRRSILSAELRQVYSALHEWSRAERFRTLHRWAESGHPDLAVEIRGLENALYSGRDGNFDRRRLARLVASAAKPQTRSQRRYALPELNPGPEAVRDADTPAFTSPLT